MTDHPTTVSQSQPEKTVGDIVAEDYRAATVFERHGIDFCCGGDRTLPQACDEAGVAVQTVLDDLQNLDDLVPPTEAGVERYNDWSPDFLADYISNQHHTYVKAALPRVEALAQKVAEAHGTDHPETREIAALWPELRGEMARHTQKEELLLFPYVRQLVRAERAGDSVAPPEFGSARALIDEMEAEHDGTGDRLGRIQALSDGFAAPADACASYRALYEELRAFDADTKKHIHLENQILFPKTIRLEERLLAA